MHLYALTVLGQSDVVETLQFIAPTDARAIGEAVRLIFGASDVGKEAGVSPQRYPLTLMVWRQDGEA